MPGWFFKQIFQRHATVHAFAEDEAVATRDAGWVELWSTDGSRRYGRGHLMLWSADLSTDVSGGSQVETDAAQPVDENGPNLRAELRGFTFDGDPPSPGDSLLVRPAKEQDSYAVRVVEVDDAEPNGRVGLDWPDDRLPASLSELGGY